MLDALARRWPGAGLAISGSVAEGRHRPDSDVDLLAVSPGFSRDVQLVVGEGGPRTNLLCLHPERAGERLRAQAHRFANPVLGYVLSARPYRDPGGHLAALQAAAAGVVRMRAERSHELLDTLRGRAAALAAGGGLGAPTVQRELLAVAVDAWFLRQGRLCLAKAEGTTPFTAIAAADPALHRAFTDLLPLLPEKAPALLALLERLFPGLSPSGAAPASTTTDG